jgi:hypothetical protein
MAKEPLNSDEHERLLNNIHDRLEAIEDAVGTSTDVLQRIHEVLNNILTEIQSR